MAKRRKVMMGNFERVNLVLNEDLADRLNLYLDETPNADKSKTIRQAIIEYLDKQLPSEPKRNIA